MPEQQPVQFNTPEAMNVLRRNAVASGFALNPFDYSMPYIEDEAENVQTECGCCNNSITEQNESAHTWIVDCLICDRCLSRNFKTCVQCKEYVFSPQVISVRNKSRRESLCPTCFEHATEENKIFHCRCCGNNYYVDSTNSAMQVCENCYERMEANGEILYRKYTPDPKLITEKIGNKITSLRPFGIELEAIVKSQPKASLASFSLPEYIGIGQDSSIDGQGIEIQTPPANGEIAELMIEKVCNALIKGELKVNTSCGYHIHIDMTDIDNLDTRGQLNAIKTVWLTYLAFEDVILSFLPQSRRTNTRYSAVLKSEYHAEEIVKAKNIDQLEALWYRINNKAEVTRAKSEHRHASRYRGINLHPLFSARHLEIRYHSGTLNKTKILEWARLHLGIIDWAVNASMGSEQLKRWVNSIDMHEKTELLFDIANCSPESKGYFRARQEAFKVKSRVTNDNHFKSGMKIITDEPEQ